MSNLSLAGGDGSHDADGGVEARAAGGDGGNGHVALYYNSRRTSVRDTGLYLLVDAPAAAALRVTAGGGPAFTGLSKDGTVVLGLPRTFGLVRAGRQKFFLTTASGYTVTVKPGAEAPDLRLVVPSSPWTRRTYRVRLPAGEAPVAIAVERGGRVVLPRGVSAACTEDCDGRYRGRAVSLAPRAEAKPKTAPKKPAPKANPGFPAELAWPPGVDGTSMASIETTETVNGVKRLVRRTYSLMKSGAFDKDAILGHYKAIFAKHGWDGLFHDTPRAANGVFVKGKNTLTLLVARVGPKRLLFRFALEVNLRDGNAPPPKKKPGDAPAPKKPAPAEPKPRPEPEKPKPAAKVLPPDRFCEMMGKLILTLEPLVLEMKKAMKGKNGEGRMMVAMEYGPKIKAASKEVYDSYGVTEKWANEASRLPKYEKAFKAYLETHPDVKAALDRLKGS